MSAPVVTEKKTRPRTFAEKQPYLFAYGAGISAFSPLASIYQLGKLNPQVELTKPRMLRLAFNVFPIQTVLKAIQMNIATPVREQFNPWVAFALVGILQGGVYGQCNIYFSKQLGMAKEVNYMGLFRGVGFAAGRDTISQGVPFMCSKWFQKNVVESVFPNTDTTTDFERSAKEWSSLFSMSLVSTYGSQFFQNCQITMQANQSLSYAGTLKEIYARNGISCMYKGAEARVGLLLVVNVLNVLLLKPCWAPVEIDE